MFHGLLSGRKLLKDSPILEQALKFLQSKGISSLPETEKAKLSEAVKACFTLSEAELMKLLSGIEPEAWESNPELTTSNEAIRLEAELFGFLPKGGFLEQYANFTMHSEAPLAYHVYCALVAVGLLVGRKVWFDMGHYKLYPPLGVFLLGPSGLRKTSAANIMLRMVQAIEITKVYPEKFTPEAVTTSIAENAQGLLYAPEMSATLGKQKYLEGLIPLLTRLQDCPDQYLTETIGRGKILIQEAAVSLLMCSTPDWFISNTPADTFGGGFVARQIMVMQSETPREEHIPTPRSKALEEDLVQRLICINTQVKGEMTMTPQCFTFHKEWYHAHQMASKNPEHPLLAAYFQRKPDHMKRLAMCLHLAERMDLTLTLTSMEHAIRILDWTEQFVPPMLKSMFKTPMGEQHDHVMQVIRNGGGMIKHSDLVRKVQHKMDAQKLRSVVSSLKEAGMLFEAQNNLQHIYFLKGKE